MSPRMLTACLTHQDAMLRMLIREQRHVDRRAVCVHLAERAPHNLPGARFHLALIGRDVYLGAQRGLSLVDATDFVPCTTASDKEEHAEQGQEQCAPWLC